MSRAKKGAASERGSAIPQEESGSDSKVELMMVKFIAMMEANSQATTNALTR